MMLICCACTSYAQQTASHYYRQTRRAYAAENWELVIKTATKLLDTAAYAARNGQQQPKFPADTLYFMLGVSYYKTGSLDGEEFVEKALSVNPNYAVANFYRGLFYDGHRNVSFAIVYYQKAVENNPKLESAWNNLCRIAKNSDPELAIQAGQMAVKLNNKYYVNYHNLGCAYVAAQNYKFAVKQFTKSIVLNGNYGWSYFFRAESYWAMKQRKELLADFAMAEKLGNAQKNIRLLTNVYNKRSFYHILNHEYAAASTDLDAAARIGKTWVLNVETERYRAILYDSLGQTKQAIALCLEIADTMPKISRAFALQAAKMTADDASSKNAQARLFAEQNCADWIENLANWLVDINSQLAFLYYKSRDNENTIAYAKKVIISNGQYSAAIYDVKARAENNLAQYQAAIVDENRAIKMQPTNARFHYTQGLALTSLKRYADAVNAFEKAIDNNNSFVDAYARKGFCEMQLKKYDAAIASFNHSLNISPRHDYALLHRAVAHKTMQEYDRAATDLETLLRTSDGNRADYFIKLAEVRFLSKKFDDCIKAASQSIAIDNKNAEAYFWQGAAYWRSGDKNAAEECFETAYKLDTRSTMKIEVDKIRLK
jgi:tetratricopeptide (TPR) repeat protein